MARFVIVLYRSFFFFLVCSPTGSIRLGGQSHLKTPALTIFLSSLLGMGSALPGSVADDKELGRSWGCKLNHDREKIKI